MGAVDRLLQRFELPFAPYPYQIEKVDGHLAHDPLRAKYFWEVATGKTLGSTLHMLHNRVELGHQNVVLMPPILIRQWYKWLNKIKGVKAKAYVGSPAKRKKFVFDTDTDFFLMSIQVFKQDFERVMDTFYVRPTTLGIDEATSVKNYESANYRRVTQFSAGQQGLLLLTGTPLTTPKDAYSYIKLTTPEVYRNFKHFENVHVAECDYFGKVKRWDNLTTLRDNLHLKASKVLKREVLPWLPEVIYADPYEYELAPHHAKLYKTLAEQQLLVYENTTIDATTPSRLFNALQQVVLNYAYFAQEQGLRPEGFDVLDECLTEADKLLVFVNYKRSNRTVIEYLASQGVLALAVNGDVSANQQIDNVERFKTDPTVRALVMNPSSGGYGVDGLQDVCNYGLFLELPTIPKDFRQAVGRLERPGQKLSPVIKVATALGTVQVRLTRNLVEKDDLVEEVYPTLLDLRTALLGG